MATKTISEQLEELSQEQRSFKATLADMFKGGSITPEAFAAAEQKAKDAEAKNTDLEAKLKAKDDEIAKLKGELEAANKAKDEALKAKTDAEASAKTTKENAEKEIQAKEESVEQRAGTKALGIEQKRGVTQPLAEEKKDNPNSEKNAGLFGRAKAQAAFEAQLAKRN